MDEFFGGLLLGLAIAIFAGLLSYSGGKDTVREQAVAAGVACYQARPDGGLSVFRWNCKQQ
jgi:hypothetical protein